MFYDHLSGHGEQKDLHHGIQVMAAQHLEKLDPNDQIKHMLQKLIKFSAAY